MDWGLVKPWVNRVGIVLEFLSFWLAAPEILGEERLRALERGFERGIVLLVLAMFVMAILAAGLAVGVALVVFMAGKGAIVNWGPVGEVALVAAIGMWLFVVLEQKVLPRLMRILADDQRIRRRSLAVGAVLFVVGFLLQLIATF